MYVVDIVFSHNGHYNGPYMTFEPKFLNTLKDTSTTQVLLWETFNIAQ